MQKRSILFVCLGNICRSPMAEAILKAKINERKLESFFEIKSCGTAGFHIGQPADYRTIEIARKYNLPMKHIAQQLDSQDFKSNDYIVVMDKSILRDVLKIAPPNAHSKVVMMRNYDKNTIDKDVPDPYYGDMKDFEKCYQILDSACEQFLLEIIKD